MDEKRKKTLEGIYANLSDEQKKKAKECKTMDELMALAGEWGIELPDEILGAVAGGGGDPELSDPGCRGYSAACDLYGTGSGGSC